MISNSENMPVTVSNYFIIVPHIYNIVNNNRMFMLIICLFDEFDTIGKELK